MNFIEIFALVMYISGGIGYGIGLYIDHEPHSPKSTRIIGSTLIAIFWFPVMIFKISRSQIYR